MSDPYASGKIKKDLYSKKKDVSGELVVVLDGVLDNRKLELIVPPSRCVIKHEVHELILTNEENAKPGSQVNKIAYLGFAEISNSGVIVAGDIFYIDGVAMGKLVGYDGTHLPNHLNIVIYSEELLSGAQRDVPLGALIEFKKVSGK